MGCLKSECQLCGKWIRANGYLQLQILQGQHEQEAHPDVFAKNKKAYEELQAKNKKAYDEYVKKQVVTFGRSSWKPTMQVNSLHCPHCNHNLGEL